MNEPILEDATWCSGCGPVLGAAEDAHGEPRIVMMGFHHDPGCTPECAAREETAAGEIVANLPPLEVSATGAPMQPTAEVPDWAEDLFPLEPIMFRHIGNYQYLQIGPRPMQALKVICSARVEADGKRWMHVSCSRPDQLPTWDNLKLVKDTFIGRDRLALQVLPRAAEYVNLHPRTLHLWSCLDGDPTPDFRVMPGLV